MAALNGFGGGGGAGGFREGKSPQDSYTSSPIACTSGSNNGIPVTAQGYAIAIGAGGAGRPNSAPGCGNRGSVSSALGVLSTGGGGGMYDGGNPSAPGGSGGGVGVCVVAVLFEDVVLVHRAAQPTAVLLLPVVLRVKEV